MRTCSKLSVLASAVLATGCFAADLDTDVSGVFVCEVDMECPLGQGCIDNLCRDYEEQVGPSVEILDPPMLGVFDPGTASIPVSVRGSNLELSAVDSDGPSVGYIEVYLDGVLVDAITEGSLEDGVQLQGLNAPEEPGLHHIVLAARHLDGERFENDESEAHIAFWIDNGEEQVGILRPAPGSRVQLGTDQLEVEIAALNFTFVNPGFIGPSETERSHEGYVHLFVDADVPGCLPECNFDYQTSIIPQGLSRVNRLRAEQGLLLPDGVGTVTLQIVAQTMANTPYYREEDPVELVYDEVPVQSVLGSGI